jgi:hypothetical protein
MNIRQLSLATLLYAVCQVPAAFADKAKPNLQLGASTGQVLTLWGEPVEKIERGLKHELVWSYPLGAFVTFKKGQVTAYRIAGGQVVDAQSEARQIAAQQTVAAAPTEVIAGSTRDLVRDIARELPSGPDVPLSDSSADASRGIVRNVPPPPAIVPGDTESVGDEEG